MNGLLIVVGIIFLISVLVGYKQGFIKIAASLAVTIAIIVLVGLLTPYVSDAILKIFPIEQTMQEKCKEILLSEQEGGEAVLPEGVETSRDAQITLIENAKLPEMFQQLLVANNNDEIYETLGVTRFTDYVGSYLAKLIANIIGYLLTFVVVSIVGRVIIGMLGIIGKLPVIGGLNRIGGAVVGLGTGLVIVWVVFIFITLLYDTEIGKTCFENIAENGFLTNLYNNNILMNYITKFRG